MKARRPSNPGLKSALVTAGAMTHTGFILFENRKFIVLLNHVTTAADLGPLKQVRTEQIEPECDVLVLPRSADMTIEVVEG